MLGRTLKAALAVIVALACAVPARAAYAEPLGGQADAPADMGTDGQPDDPPDGGEPGDGAAEPGPPDAVPGLDGQPAGQPSGGDAAPPDGGGADGGLPVLPAAYDAPLAAGQYVIRPACSNGRVLDVVGGATGDGAYLNLYDSHMGLCQRFNVSVDPSSGTYTILAAHSGKAVDVMGERAASGTRVWQWRPLGNGAQRWIVSEDPRRPGAFILTSALSTPGNRLVLDVCGGNDRNGEEVRVWTANGGSAQSFYFMPAPPAVDPGGYVVPDGFYTIASRLPGGLVLDVSGGSEAAGAAVQLFQPNGYLAQDFLVRRHPDGFYSIHPANSASAALDVQGGNLVAGTTVWQWPDNGLDCQRWAIRPNADGSVGFISKATGMALDVVGNTGFAGNRVWQWYQTGVAGQRFTLSAPPVLRGYARIRPWASMDKSVDVAGASYSSGASIWAYTSNDHFAQVFSVVPAGAGAYALRSALSGCYVTASGGGVVQQVGDASGAAGPMDYQPKPSQLWQLQLVQGGYVITSVATGQAMTLSPGGSAGLDIRLATPSGSRSQVFKVEFVPLLPPARVYTVSNPAGLRLDESGGRVTNGNPIQLYVANGGDAQKWSLRWKTGEYFVLACPRSGRALEIAGNSTVDGSQVQLWDYNGCNGQLWRLVPSGDGWFYLQSASGMYIQAGGAAASGTPLTVSASITGGTQRFRLNESSYSGLSGTYVDVNLSTQHLLYVRDGVIILECDIVTGKPSTPTPTGTYHILSKSSPATLVGPGYARPVKYWMPFTNRGHGLHDASWQPWFGGDRWQTGGSMGCVNMPEWAARDLYAVIRVGDTVYIHW